MGLAQEGFRYVTTRVYQTGTTPNEIIAELPFTNVNYTNQLSSSGTFQGHVLLSGAKDLNAYEGTTPGRTILWVLYTSPYDGTTTPVWSGVIWAREYDSVSQTLAVSAQEMMSLYNRRLISTTKDYSDTNYDPTYIAHQLMIYAEGLTYGKTGLTYDVSSTTYVTKKKYNGYELKSVQQAIKDLSANYFDFRIYPKKNANSQLINCFQAASPLGTTYSASSSTAPVFELPGNMISYRFPEDAANAANKLYGIGAAGTNSTQTIAIATDTLQNTTNGFPLLEATANYSDAGSTNLLKALTKGQIEATSYPPTTVEVVIPPYIDPYYPNYKVGDQVRLIIRDAYFPSGIDFGTDPKPMRIMAISVQPGENGPSRVTLTLTRDLSAGAATE